MRKTVLPLFASILLISCGSEGGGPEPVDAPIEDAGINTFDSTIDTGMQTDAELQTDAVIQTDAELQMDAEMQMDADSQEDASSDPCDTWDFAILGFPNCGPAPLVVTFYSMNAFPYTEEIYSACWDFGDGDGICEAFPGDIPIDHTYTLPGEYNVFLESDVVINGQEHNLTSLEMVLVY